MIIGYADLRALIDTVIIIAVFVLGIWLGSVERKSRNKVLDELKKDKK